MKTVKKAQVGKKVSGPKKPIKQYSEIDAGRLSREAGRRI